MEERAAGGECSCVCCLVLVVCGVGLVAVWGFGPVVVQCVGECWGAGGSL